MEGLARAALSALLIAVAAACGSSSGREGFSPGRPDGGGGDDSSMAGDGAGNASDAAAHDGAAIEGAIQDGGRADGSPERGDASPGTDGAPNATFRSPINVGPDPFMTYYAGNYYVSSTQGDALRMWKAPSIGEILAAPPTVIWQDGDPSRNQQVWAPSFYLISGHWYVYYTADDGTDANHRLYVVESDGTDPLGPYHFKAQLNVPGSNDWAIDPVLIPQSGGLYIAWSGAGPPGHNIIYVAAMSDPWTISGPRTYVYADGGCTEVREAPSIVQHGGTTFLVYSTCDTGKPDYQLWTMSIPTNSDPTVASNWRRLPGAAFTRNDAAGVWGPGSNGFFKSPDGTEDWIVYHGKNTSQFTYDARDTRAQKIDWNADGTPNLGVPLAVAATQSVPSGDPGGGPYWINDTGMSSGPGGVAYSSGWNAFSTCGVQCFWGDDHGTAQAGATATFTFTGTKIALLSARDSGNGIAAMSVDNGPESTWDYYLPIRQGQQLVYVSPPLAFGSHTLQVRVTGNRNSASAGAAISIDRAEVYAN